MIKKGGEAMASPPFLIITAEREPLYVHFENSSPQPLLTISRIGS
jgi:hypothetical protein